QIDLAAGGVEGRKTIAVGVVAVLRFRSGSREASQAVSAVVSGGPADGSLIQLGRGLGLAIDHGRDRALRPQALGDAGDPGGSVIAVAGDLALRHAAVGVEGPVRGVAVGPA